MATVIATTATTPTAAAERQGAAVQHRVTQEGKIGATTGAKINQVARI